MLQSRSRRSEGNRRREIGVENRILPESESKIYARLPTPSVAQKSDKNVRYVLR